MKAASIAVRTLVALISAVLLLWSNLNFFTAGTIIGWVVFSLIIALCIFWKPFCGLVKWLWKRVWGKITLIFLGSLTALIMGFCVFFTVNIALHAEIPLEKTEAVIILGCQVRGETPSQMLKRRIEAAIDVLNENPEAVCVMSGGKGNGEDISEAECMRRYLTDAGIDEARLFVEDKSTSTRENLAFSAEILENLSISENIMLVTNEFHQYRASIYASRAGLKTGAHSAKTPLRNLLNYGLRENAALFAACVG